MFHRACFPRTRFWPGEIARGLIVNDFGASTCAGFDRRVGSAVNVLKDIAEIWIGGLPSGHSFFFCMVRYRNWAGTIIRHLCLE